MHTTMLRLMAPGGHRDPYRLYRRLHAKGSAQLRPFGLWVISSYEDAWTLLRHPAVSSECHNPLFDRFFRDEADGLRTTMLFRDPPDHTRLRHLVNKAFTARRVGQMRGQIEEVAERLADGLDRTGFDLMAEFAYPLPTTVICEFLGIPEADRVQFAAWMRAIAERFNVQPALLLPGAGARKVRSGQEAMIHFAAYCIGLIADRRAHPRDDFLSALIAAEEEGSRLSEEELVAMTVLLLVGGHETVASMIGNGTLALLRQPAQLHRLREEPEIIGSAVEELLRFDTSAQMVVRTALEDIDLGRRTIRKGQLILIILGAANRDPGTFADPDRLDLARDPNPHLTFISGRHFCLGAPLARLELQVAFSTLVRRFPDIRLETDRPQWRDTIALHGLKSLPLSGRYAPQRASSA